MVPIELATPELKRLRAAPVAVEVARGMRCLDTTANPRIPVLMELVGALSRATDHREVQRIFGAGVGRLYGRDGYISLSTRNLPPGSYRITRLITGRNGRSFEDSDPWSEITSIPIHQGGFLGEIIRSAYPEVIHDLDVSDDLVLGDALTEYRALMAIPLFDNGEPLNWAIMLHRDPEGFTMQELEESILRGNLVGNTIKNKLMARELEEAHARIRREIEEIARIQRALLPQKLPEIPGVSLAASYETFDTAGGDMYDFAWLRTKPDGTWDKDGPLAVLIADAAGHGPAAAVVGAMLNAILYACPREYMDEPGKMLRHANRHLFAKGIDGTFVTAFLAAYDRGTRRLTYARAGHNPPLLKNPGSGGAVSRLDAVGDLPLGVAGDVVFSNAEVTLARGQTVVFYTDGITEAVNPAGAQFGVEGIERALHACSGAPACVVESITTALKEHEAGVRPSDDQTIVALKVE